MKHFSGETNSIQQTIRRKLNSGKDNVEIKLQGL